jgi:hypothetical protein
MPRAGNVYRPGPGTGDTHKQQNSTDDTDVVTFTAPGKLRGATDAERFAKPAGFYIDCETNNCRFTWDESTPSPTNGILKIAGSDAGFYPIQVVAVKAVSDAAAAASLIDIGWVY